MSPRQYKGNVVLVNFWATGGDPATSKFPAHRNATKYAAKASPSSRLHWMKKVSRRRSFLSKERFNVNGQKLPMNYPSSSATTMSLTNSRPARLSHTFLISKDGKIVKKVQGLISYEELTKEIEAQL